MSDPSPIEQIRARCATQPAADLGFPFGDDAAVYKVGGKMFALVTVDADPGHVTVKADPDDVVALQAQYPFVGPGYYMNKRHWVTVALVDDEAVGLALELVEDSHRIVASALSRRVRDELGIEAP